MNVEQLRHAIRVAASAIEAHEVIVIGSQVILASTPADRLPAVATHSLEADVMSRDGTAADADLIDALVGELSRFHETHGYYAQGVDVTAARLPAGWRERLVPLECEFPVPHSNLGGRVTGWCFESHDLSSSVRPSISISSSSGSGRASRSASRGGSTAGLGWHGAPGRP